MYVVCRLLGHKRPPFPYPTPEWRIVGTRAALVDVYRCERCTDEL